MHRDFRLRVLYISAEKNHDDCDSFKYKNYYDILIYVFDEHPSLLKVLYTAWTEIKPHRYLCEYDNIILPVAARHSNILIMSTIRGWITDITNFGRYLQSWMSTIIIITPVFFFSVWWQSVYIKEKQHFFSTKTRAALALVASPIAHKRFE